MTVRRAGRRAGRQPEEDQRVAAGVSEVHRAAGAGPDAGASGSNEELLGARGLLDRRGALTNAAYLLFGQHPQDLFPQAYVRVLRFLTRERGTGGRLGLDDDADIRIEGPIPLVIQHARAEIDKLVPRRRALSAASGSFEPTPLIPPDAWLEGLVNAVVHRSYSLGGDHIRVEIYPDRIEIESPGRFPGLSDPARPLEISRFARNPRIARVCADLRIGQELGEGIKRIFEEMRAVGLSDPIYRQTGGNSTTPSCVGQECTTASLSGDFWEALGRATSRP